MSRADPTCLTKPRSDKEGVHQQRVVTDSGRVKSAELTPRAIRECIKKEAHLGGVRVQTYPTSKEGVHQQRVVPDFGRINVQS